MPISTTWVNPSAGGTLDLATGSVLTEAWCDGVASDLLRLGGVAGAVTQTGLASSVSDFVTTSTSFVDVTSLSVTITTTGGDVLIWYVGPTKIAGGGNAQLTLSQDAVDLSVQAATASTSDTSTPMMTKYTAPSAAAHTYKVRARAQSVGTVTLSFTQVAGTLIAMELKR